MPPVIRTAVERDLPRIVELLAQLSLDEPREQLTRPLPAEYERAFSEVSTDQRQALLVAEDEGVLVGSATVIVVPNISHMGRPYAVVEDVVVDAPARGRRIGEALMARAVEIAREAGCYKVVLTSNRVRVDAHRFYERIGFKYTHAGFRMDL